MSLETKEFSMEKYCNLQVEYYILLKEFEEGNRRMKHIKQRMVQIRKAIRINPQIVDDRPDEILLKEK